MLVNHGTKYVFVGRRSTVGTRVEYGSTRSRKAAIYPCLFEPILAAYERRDVQRCSCTQHELGYFSLLSQPLKKWKCFQLCFLCRYHNSAGWSTSRHSHRWKQPSQNSIFWNMKGIFFNWIIYEEQERKSMFIAEIITAHLNTSIH